MTSTAKTTAATDLTLSYLTDTETADAADVAIPFGECETDIDEARETVSVSSADTHVKNLEDALVGVANQFAVTKINSGADEQLRLNLDPAGVTSGYAPVANGANGWAWADPSGGGAQPVDVTATAGEALAERDTAYFNASDGEWYKIDTDADPPACGWPRGIVNESGGIAASGTGSIRLLGEVSGYTGLAANALVYADTTAGGVTQTRPTVTKGGSQKAVVVLGLAVSTTNILVLPTSPARFVKRADLAADGTLTLKHFIDAAEQSRELVAFLSSTVAGSSLTSYADSNQDADVALKGPDGAGGTTDITAANDGDAEIKDESGATTWRAQSFQITNGVLDQIQVRHGANGGSPSGTITWEICSDNSGAPDRTDILDSGTYTPTASTINTITVSGGVCLLGSATYWLVLRPTSTQSAGNYWTARRSTSSIYASGNLSSWNGTSWNASTVQDLSVSVRTAAATSYDKLAQSFQVTGAQTVGSVKLWMKKAGSPTGNLTVKIETDSAGSPSGTPVTNGTSNTVAASTPTTSYGWIEFTFATNPSLSGSTTYWIVLETADTQSDTNYVEWGDDESSPGYTNGEMKSEASSTWSALTADAIFDVLGEGTVYDEPIAIGSWTLEELKMAARFDDGSGSNADTQSTFKNLHTATLDLTCEVRLQ